MSRETDTSSSGPQGREQTAYPSGTQPYGSAQDEASEKSTGSDAAGAPEDPKTETTLTTRIRINIPGSRPIPPVVVRKPVNEQAAPPTGTVGAAGSGSGAAAAPAPRRPEAAEGPRAPQAAPGAPLPVREKKAPKQAGAPGEKAEKSGSARTSDWFAPRKPTHAGAGAPDSTAGSPPSVPGARAPEGGAPAAGPRPGAPAGSGIPGADVRGTAPGASANGPRPAEPDTGGFPLSGTGGTGGTGPQSPADTAAFPAVGQGHEDTGARPRATGGYPAPVPGAPGTDTGGYSLPGDHGPVGLQHPGHGGQLERNPLAVGDPGGDPGVGDLPYFRPDAGPTGPTGPTGGPATGDGPLGADGPPVRRPGAPGHRGAPAADETAVLTPQPSGPEPARPGGNVSGDTLTSGIPVVPPVADSPYAPGGPGVVPDGAEEPQARPQPPAPAPTPVPAARAPKKAPKKKGRNKLVLVGVAVVVAAGVAYGAGLLLNHSDVPAGTTVLGIDIGGGTRDDAVQKLDAGLGNRLTKPLKLSVGGDTVELRPEQAGLTLDTDATVGEASGSDYNPVSVIGSLFGGERVVEPVVPVDEEKLRAALERAAGGSGTATEGTIRFEPGKAVPVYGKSGEGIDVKAGAEAVEEAYRTQVAKGSAGTVRMPTVTREPSVPKAEVDRMMQSFATTAMSGLVTVQTDAEHTISFSPERSIHQFLSVRAVDGKLVEHYDLKVLKELYGGAFDGATIAKADGTRKPVSPQDVASALGKALRGKTPEERIVTIPTDVQ